MLSNTLFSNNLLKKRLSCRNFGLEVFNFEFRCSILLFDGIWGWILTAALFTSPNLATAIAKQTWVTNDCILRSKGLFHFNDGGQFLWTSKVDKFKSSPRIFVRLRSRKPVLRGPVVGKLGSWVGELVTNSYTSVFNPVVCRRQLWGAFFAQNYPRDVVSEKCGQQKKTSLEISLLLLYPRFLSQRKSPLAPIKWNFFRFFLSSYTEFAPFFSCIKFWFFFLYFTKLYTIFAGIFFVTVPSFRRNSFAELFFGKIFLMMPTLF